MLSKRISRDEMKAQMLESLLDLWAWGDLELAVIAARDFTCRHADDGEEARCPVCRMAGDNYVA